MVRAASARLKQKRSVTSRYGGPTQFIRIDLLLVERDGAQYLPHRYRTHPGLSASIFDAVFVALPCRLDDLVKQNDLTVVFLSQRWNIINRCVKVLKELAGGISDQQLLLTRNTCARLHPLGFIQQLGPFEKGRAAVLLNRHILDVQTAHIRATHFGATAGGGDEERHSALLHWAPSLTRLEVAAVVLCLLETGVELP